MDFLKSFIAYVSFPLLLQEIIPAIHAGISSVLKHHFMTVNEIQLPDLSIIRPGAEMKYDFQLRMKLPILPTFA